MIPKERDSGEWHIRFRRSEEADLQRRLMNAERDLADAIEALTELREKLNVALDRARIER